MPATSVRSRPDPVANDAMIASRTSPGSWRVRADPALTGEGRVVGVAVALVADADTSGSTTGAGVPPTRLMLPPDAVHPAVAATTSRRAARQGRRVTAGTYDGRPASAPRTTVRAWWIRALTVPSGRSRRRAISAYSRSHRSRSKNAVTRAVAARRFNERYVLRAEFALTSRSQVENRERPSNRVMFRATETSTSWQASSASWRPGRHVAQERSTR